MYSIFSCDSSSSLNAPYALEAKVGPTSLQPLFTSSASIAKSDAHYCVVWSVRGLPSLS